MIKKEEAVKIINMRGMVLTNLNRLYPSPITLRSLYRTVCYEPTYDFDLFKKDITYFMQKGYIEFSDEKIGGCTKFDDKVCMLTAEGKEIAEGTMKDPALEI